MRVVVHEWITGGGFAGLPLPKGLAREGGAMRRALADDLRQIPGVRPIVLLDGRFADEEPEVQGECIVVPPGAAEAVLADQARGADFTLVVAPETGGLLARLLARLEALGARSLGSSAAAVALAGDKLRFADELNRRGIATVPTLSYDEAQSGRIDWSGPTVVKPRDGAGSEATRVVPSPAELIDQPDPGTPMLVQPWVEGEPMSASYLVGPDGSIQPLGVAWQSIRVDRGWVAYDGGLVPAPSELAMGEPRRAVAAIGGLIGYVGVDFLRRPDGDCVVLEVNPRLTTSYVGLRQIHPPGAILREWINLVACRPSEGLLSRPGRSGSAGLIRFRADGTFLARPNEHVP